MAFEQLLVPWRSERLLCDDGELLVVDKPPGVVVHGGDERLADDVISRLRHWLRDRGRDDYLGVHQRLDKEASGVLLFTRKREVNPIVSQQIESRAARKVYVAAVRLDARSMLAKQGVLEDLLAKGSDGRVHTVRKGGQHAVARYRMLEQRGDRALLELCLETGRTHQLRVQLADRGAPIAGDDLYGGPPAPRLMLHATELTLPALERRFVSPLPAEFVQWLEARAPSIGDHDELLQRLADAGCRRNALTEIADAFRLANDIADGLAGVSVDRYADYAVLAVSSEEALLRYQELADALIALGARGVYLKRRVRSDLRHADVSELAPVLPVAGEPAPEELVVNEAGLRLLVRLGDGMSTGLFVDQRDNRRRVREHAAGATMLNLFCYTCSFSVAAAAGGAVTTVNVDLSGRALDLGRRNFELNALDPAAHRFVKADVMDWLRRARKRPDRFGVIVLDPPSFSTGQKSTFRVAHDYTKVATDSLGLLASGGMLLAVTNHRTTSQTKLRRMLHEAARAAGRRVVQMKDLPSSMDCAPSPSGPPPSKSVLVSVE